MIRAGARRAFRRPVRVAGDERACRAGRPACGPAFWDASWARLWRTAPLGAWRRVRLVRDAAGDRESIVGAVRLARAAADFPGAVVDKNARPCDLDSDKPCQLSGIMTVLAAIAKRALSKHVAAAAGP